MTLSPGTPVWCHGSSDRWAVVRPMRPGISGTVHHYRIRNERTGKERTANRHQLRPRRTADTPARSHLAPEVARQGTDRRPPMVEQPKRQRYEDPAYLAWVRTLPCAWCGARPPSDPHHWPTRARGGHDYQTVPLCRADHDAFHAGRLGDMTVAQASEWALRVGYETLCEWAAHERETGT